jgi:hypothetical protein
VSSPKNYEAKHDRGDKSYPYIWQNRKTEQHVWVNALKRKGNNVYDAKPKTADYYKIKVGPKPGSLKTSIIGTVDTLDKARKKAVRWMEKNPTTTSARLRNRHIRKGKNPRRDKR